MPLPTLRTNHRRRLALAVLAAFAVDARAAEPTATVVEFHDATENRHLLTASPSEAAALDAGAANTSWKRTGVEWSAWARATDQSGTVPVCRFSVQSTTGTDFRFHTASADECEAMKLDPDWSYEGTPFWIGPPHPTSAAGTCGAGTTSVYRSHVAADAPPGANLRLVTDLTLHTRMAPRSILDGVAMCSPLSSRQIDADIVRLLEQATWGPTDASIADVRERGIAAFVDAELALPSTRTTEFAPVPNNRPDTCVDDRTPPLTATSYCARDNYTLFQLQREFFRNAITAPDQLRQRVAFALSQILVTSGTDVRTAYAMQRYQQLLADLAFGNFHSPAGRTRRRPARPAGRAIPRTTPAAWRNATRCTIRARRH